MASSDPKQVICDYLSQPLGQLQPGPPPSPDAPLTRWQGEIRSGGGLGARASTIQFLQERLLPDRQVHLVAFENETGEQQQWICCIIASDAGEWQFVGGANISGEETMPRRDYPWVGLASGGRDLLWAGGRVLDQGLGVIRVRLLSANSIMLEDTVQDGLVLFVTDQEVRGPLRVELYDRSGKVVGTHQIIPWKPPEELASPTCIVSKTTTYQSRCQRGDKSSNPDPG
jgi:hypothetical protein